jgi:hypothetical protein
MLGHPTTCESVTWDIWDEERTPFREEPFLDAATYTMPGIFDLEPSESLSPTYLVSPKKSFAYTHRLLPAVRPLAAERPSMRQTRPTNELLPEL